MRLELTILDMNTPRVQARQSLTLRPVGGPLAEVRLDARLLDIRDVAAPGREAGFTHDGMNLVVTISPPAEQYEVVELVTSYVIDDPRRGMLWTPESPAWPGRAAQIHTQGQPETNSYWFPCHDYPNDRITSELIVTVPHGFLVVSNGRLAERRPVVITRPSIAAEEVDRIDPRGYERFHWLQSLDHVPYLVSLVVGKFDVVDVSNRKRRLPMPVYVPPGRGPDVQATYGRTAAMVDFFANLLGEPYPWEKYAQVLVWNFAHGGMENTSATTMYDTALFPAARAWEEDLEGLISHELAHQWFGDLITCKSWEHIWLNEGFATYLTALWVEGRRPTDHLRAGGEEYLRHMLAIMDGVAARDKGSAPEHVGMVSRSYHDAWDTFGRPANPYGKGASILHMLRLRLGDKAFFDGLREYVARHRFGLVATDDFRLALEDVSGRELGEFFTQWCRRPGVPRLRVVADWSDSTGEVVISLLQTQPIDGENPPFHFDLPVYVQTERGGTLRLFPMEVRDRQATLAVPMSARPTMVVVDPQLAVLCELEFVAPAPWLAEQLRSGPTVVAKTRAARALSEASDEASLHALRDFAVDRAQPLSSRGEALRAIARRGEWMLLEQLLSRSGERWELRVDQCDALSTLARLERFEGHRAVRSLAVSSLTRRVQSDASTKVRAAALRALGEMKAVDQFDVILGALRQDSQDDRVRHAALDALAGIDDAAGLRHALVFTRPGYLSRTRAKATEVVGKLGKHDADDAASRLIALLDDGEMRVRRAAGEALVELGTARAAAALERAASTARDPADRKQARRWLAKMAEAASSAP